jgi:hypothetical protein
MTNIEPGGGTVTLRGVKIDVNSDIGHAFTIDCTRFVEGLITEEQLKAKYGLTEEGWRQLETNEPLQRAVGAQKEKRIRSGDAAREMAQHRFLAVPNVLSGIVNDATASPRHRIEALQPLRRRRQKWPSRPGQPERPFGPEWRAQLW